MLDPVGQYMLLNWDIGHHYDANYMADAFGTKLTELGRAGYLQYCLKSEQVNPVQQGSRPATPR